MGKKEVLYEWKVEHTERESFDVMDSEYFNTYREAMEEPPQPGTFIKVCLVMDVGCEEHGLSDRGHAYVNCDILAPFFDIGEQVPARFMKEVGDYHGY